MKSPLFNEHPSTLRGLYEQERLAPSSSKIVRGDMMMANLVGSKLIFEIWEPHSPKGGFTPAKLILFVDKEYRVHHAMTLSLLEPETTFDKFIEDWHVARDLVITINSHLHCGSTHIGRSRDRTTSRTEHFLLITAEFAKGQAADTPVEDMVLSSMTTHHPDPHAHPLSADRSFTTCSTYKDHHLDLFDNTN